MIILIRSNDANPDPRLQKYINYLNETNEQYTVIAWNRGNGVMEKENYIYFNKPTAFGLGVKNIPNKMSWFVFVVKQLLVLRKKYKVIHACDLDTAIPAFIIKKLLNKKIVFDVFDWVSSTERKSLFGKGLSKVENYIFKNSDYTILCEQYRINQVREDARRESLILPNIPDLQFGPDEAIESLISEQQHQYRIVLSYVGVFDKNRGLEDILDIVSTNKEICLNIAGFGFLEKQVKEVASEHENINYWGKVDYNTGLNIMKNSDIIMAMYYLTNEVHKYAAPNKYYEGLFLGKAIFTNEGTLLAEKIMSENTGYVIEEGRNGIEEFLSNWSATNELEMKNKNSRTLWENYFKNYTKKFMENSYQEILK